MNGLTIMPSRFMKGLISLGLKLTKLSVHLKVHCATLEAVGVGAKLLLLMFILDLECTKLEKMRTRRMMQIRRLSLKIIQQVKMIKREIKVKKVKVEVKREAPLALMMIWITRTIDGTWAGVASFWTYGVGGSWGWCASFWTYGVGGSWGWCASFWT
uniref:Uncharacterized protein n=1 Tax=Triticum urartu TaxID=4572 RepID=A0A8R7PKV1_TRIUA